MNLEELIDISHVQELFQSFSDITGVGTALVDLKGKVLIATNWQKSCTHFHRVNKETAANCHESDTILASQLNAGEKFNLYRCKNGLVDVAAPIFVGGSHIANLFIGQFFIQDSPPDIDDFSQKVRRYGFDEEQYIAAIKNVPIYSMEEVNQYMNFLCKLSELISSHGEQKRKVLELNQRLIEDTNRANDILNHLQTMASIGGWEFDVVSKKSFWTKGVYDIYGLPYDTDIHTIDKLNYIRENDRLRLQKHVDECIKNGTSYDLELHFTNHHGEDLVVRSIGNPIFNDQGEVVKIRGAFKDISKFKKIENQLSQELENKQKSISFFKSIQDNAAHALVSTDTQGIITSFSTAAEEILGYKAEELVGKQNPGIFHDLEEVMQRSQEFSQKLGRKVEPGFDTFVCHSEEGLKNQFEWTYVHKDGTKFPVILSITVLYDDDNNKIGYLGISEDLREQKALEAKLENERLKLMQSSKLATLGEMAAGVAHEINNPLAIISGCAMIIGRFNISEEKRKENIERINKSVKRISRIVSGLKRFSRSKDSSNLQVLNLRTLITESIELSQSKSHQYHTPIKFEFDQDFEVYVDDIQIEQILLNLIGNAIDANANQKNPWVEISIESDETSYQIIVKDSGTGIEDYTVEKLFDPFFTTKEIGKGTGLGLSISKGIAQDHGGDLHYELRDGHTAFILIIPKEFKQENVA